MKNGLAVKEALQIKQANAYAQPKKLGFHLIAIAYHAHHKT